MLIKATQSSEVTQKEKTRERIVLSADAAIIEGKGDLSYQNLNKELENEFGKDNYKILSVGKGYLIIVDNVQYKIDKSGKVEEGNEIVESTIEFAGDLSKGGKYDGTTEETAYQINCIEDLVEWSKNYGKYQSSYISLERTLDFESTDSYMDYTAITTDINGNGELEALIEELTTGMGFLPIANFTGTLDGKNNEIRNLYENRTGAGGLILSATGIKISNLGITGEIKATSNAAGLIASSNLSNIVNSYNRCNVEGVITGGLIGEAGTNSTHRVYNCYNEGIIVGKTYSGGILGECHGNACKTNVYNCYNIGEVKSEQHAGGIWGKLNRKRNFRKLL